MAQQHIPGLAVGVLRDRKLVWSRGYGHSDLEQRVAMTPDTIQNIASISKTFTETAVMQLWEEGKFQLDDDINRHLSFEVAHPVHRDTPITFRHLMAHLSSIDDGPAYAQAYACGDPTLSLEEWLHAYLTPTGPNYDAARNFHTWAPGSGFSYCNVAYGLLGHLVERLSGLPFEDYCRQHVFAPLGMHETSWYLKNITPSRHAVPYSWVSGGTVRGPAWGGLPTGVVGRPDAAAHVHDDYAANCLYNHPNYPDGFLRTSVHQLCRFAQAYLDEGRYGDTQLLRGETIQRMFRAESGDENRVMGLTWNAQRRAGGDLLWGHGGSDPGVNTNLRLRFEDGVAGIVLMNTNAGREDALPAPLEFAEYLVDHSHEF